MLDLELFGRDNIDFLENNMWLDLKYIQDEIEKDAYEYKAYFREIFNFIVEKYTYYKEEYEENPFTAFDKLDDELMDIDKKHHIQEGTDSEDLGYVFRKLFIHFVSEGVVGAYKGQDIVSWYPKIVFKERIESDINCLDPNLIIYRGTSEKEFESKKFGQSWSLDKSIASYFAFSDDFDYAGTTRVILESKISREDVLYYNQDESEWYREEEIVVDSEKLKNTILIEKKILKERD